MLAELTAFKRFTDGGGCRDGAKTLWKDILQEKNFQSKRFVLQCATEVMDGDIVPVAMGSNMEAQGVANLLSDIVRFFPVWIRELVWASTARQMIFLKQIMILQKERQRMCLRQWWILVYWKVLICKSVFEVS